MAYSTNYSTLEDWRRYVDELLRGSDENIDQEEEDEDDAGFCSPTKSPSAKRPRMNLAPLTAYQFPLANAAPTASIVSAPTRPPTAPLKTPPTRPPTAPINAPPAAPPTSSGDGDSALMAKRKLRFDEFDFSTSKQSKTSAGDRKLSEKLPVKASRKLPVKASTKLPTNDSVEVPAPGFDRVDDVIGGGTDLTRRLRRCVNILGESTP